MKKRYFPCILSGFLLFTILMVQLTACGPMKDEGGSAKVLQSQTSRNMNPASTSEDMEELAGGNNAFAFDYYQSVRDQGATCFSRRSVCLSL